MSLTRSVYPFHLAPAVPEPIATEADSAGLSIYFDVRCSNDRVVVTAMHAHGPRRAVLHGGSLEPTWRYPAITIENIAEYGRIP